MSNHQGLTQFYVLVGVINLVVALMFYSVCFYPLPPPVSHAVVARMTPRAKEVPATVGIPTRIVIPSVAIDLPVGVGTYDPVSASWTVDDARAYFADASMPLNNSNGTTLIYGHAQAPVFARLPQMQTGEEAVVYTDTGYTFAYRYTSVKEVLPTDTSVFQSDGPPTLTLQTCAGAWDAYRALFSFQLTEVSKL